jgi:beta-mannosidase
MFAGAQYPPRDWFLKEVAGELESQVRRHRHHASIMIWCGDNEIYRMSPWIWDHSAHSEWLRRQYIKFNQFIKAEIAKHDPSRRFWPSSPADGSFDYYGDGKWQSQHSGDIHYWDVWHGRKPFEEFYHIKPRFCSEFGFQSWCSLPTVKTFCPPNEFDIKSPTMKLHQKNSAGNDLIQNMFHFYFKLPKNFEQQLYLSQVQQAYAIRMGCEWFRTCKPITRGMMFWQLNDCWPVASWASIEYTGRWKQLQYHAARFYAPLLATFHQVKKTDPVRLFIVSDRLDAVRVKGSVKFIGFDGKTIHEWLDIEHHADIDSAKEVWNLNLSGWSEDERHSGFFYCEFKTLETTDPKTFTNFWFPCLFKDSKMQVARISVSVRREGSNSEIILKSDVPAFFVHLESEKVLQFSDSSFVLLPGVSKKVTCVELVGLHDLSVYQLASVGQ